MSDAKTLGCLLCVICAACAPAIKLCAALVKMPDMGDDARNGNDCSARGANQCVIDIDINGKWHWLSFTASALRRLTTPSSATGAAGATAARRGKGGGRKQRA